jgi:hypothetical protein
VFLIKDSSPSREERIKQFLLEDPPLAALLAVVHFEWTIRRAIIALGTSPNVEIRIKLERCHGCDAYKDIWRDEVFPRIKSRLPQIVNNWDGLIRAFRLRHRLVHGVTSCGRDYASDRVYWAIEAANDVREACIVYGIDLDLRLPVRKRLESKRHLSNQV